MSEYIFFQRMFQQLDFLREKMSWFRVSINVGRGLYVGEGVKGEWFSGKKGLSEFFGTYRKCL